MINKIGFREFLAWMTLAIAVILFSVSIAFAQTKTVNVDERDGKVHIKINMTENGKTTNIDTTIDATNGTDIDKIVEQLSGTSGEDNSIGNNQVHVYKFKDSDDGGNKRKHVNVDVRVPKMSEQDKQKLHDELKKSMGEMRRNLAEMQRSLKSMHIDLGDENDKDFNFGFDLPDLKMGDNGCHIYKYKYSTDDDSIDSLDDKDHIIIPGHEGEDPPVLEKVIKTKNGKQVFIYKRSEIKKDDDKNTTERKDDDLPGINDIRYFPNPSKGKFNLQFHSDVKSDITIQIVDESSKVVYSDKLKDFEGDYSKTIDISGKRSGSYILKISNFSGSVSKKIVFN